MLSNVLNGETRLTFLFNFAIIIWSNIIQNSMMLLRIYFLFISLTIESKKERNVSIALSLIISSIQYSLFLFWIDQLCKFRWSWIRCKSTHCNNKTIDLSNLDNLPKILQFQISMFIKICNTDNENLESYRSIIVAYTTQFQKKIIRTACYWSLREYEITLF